MRAGDWNCPVESCQFHNFASRRYCKQCNEPKPRDEDNAKDNAKDGEEADRRNDRPESTPQRTRGRGRGRGFGDRGGRDNYGGRGGGRDGGYTYGRGAEQFGDTPPRFSAENMLPYDVEKESDIARLVRERSEARRDKDYALADQIQEELRTRNVRVEDGRAFSGRFVEEDGRPGFFPGFTREGDLRMVRKQRIAAGHRLPGGRERRPGTRSYFDETGNLKPRGGLDARVEEWTSGAAGGGRGRGAGRGGRGGGRGGGNETPPHDHSARIAALEAAGP